MRIGDQAMTVASARYQAVCEDAPFLDPNGMVYGLCGSPVGPIAGMRSFFLQALHPHAMAGVDAFSMYEGNPVTRFERTSRYVETTFYGTHAQALEAGAIVQGLHRRVNGEDPVTGTRFSAMDPETLLYVHCCEMESILETYHQLWRKVTIEQRDAFYAETVAVAELVGIPAAIVPSSDAEMRAYFTRMWPRLCSSQATAKIVRNLVTADWGIPEPLKPVQRFWAYASISTVPERARAISPPPVSDAKVAAATAVTRAFLMAIRPVWNERLFAKRVISAAQRKPFGALWREHGDNGKRDRIPGETPGCPFH